MNKRKETPEEKADRIARTKATRERHQAIRAANNAREHEASLPQPPLSAEEREAVKAEIAKNAADIRLIQELLDSRRRLNRANFELRSPEQA
jgi:hypothetical protein